MANYKVPSQAASGFETFSDSIVGRQITDGTSQLTNTNFALDKIIPEKDSKSFRSAPFSEFLTLDELKIETDVPTTVVQASGEKRPIRFNPSKADGAKSLFGSLRERIGVSIGRIIRNFPAGFLIDSKGISSVSDNSAENIVYDPITKRTTFSSQSKKIFNPYDISLSKPKSGNGTNVENKIRNFYSSYTKYSIVVEGNLYSITKYTEPNANNDITFIVKGNPFTGSTYSGNILVRPNNAVVEEFYLGLDDLEQTLLNRETVPIYQASFLVPNSSLDQIKTDLVSAVVNWPISRDGWNPQIVGSNYDSYIQKLNDLATEIDDYKSNLVTRFLVAPQLFEFDTEDQKIDKIFQLYGQSFDKVKSYIDNIAYMRNVSYDSINNIPDVFLKNLANTLGLNTIDLFDEKTLEDQIYNASQVLYDGQSIGKNLVEAELEFYRRLLVNLAFIYKSKGTRSSLEFFLKFIGAPDPMIKINEYVYDIKKVISKSVVDDDIFNVVNNISTNNSVEFNPTTYTYTLSAITGVTTVSDTTDYPVSSDNYLPKTPLTNQDNIFFQMGSGWNDITLDHRSSDMLDTENSVTTGRTKTLITKSKPYTYGEDFFNIYRTLPGLDYGYTLHGRIDNKKSQVLDSELDGSLVLNRKNINVFVSPANATNYDIWRKSRELEISFGSNTLEPQTTTSFADYLNDVFSTQVVNSNVVKYKKNYIHLEDVYQDYVNKMIASGYTPYDLIDSSNFVNQMSPYWSSVLEQIIPATTLWLGGNLIENNIFGRPKFTYRKPCEPIEVVENLYPDFETFIEEDIETLFVGDPDYLRGLVYLSGVTFTLKMDIDGVIYTGATQVNLNGTTLFGTSGFTASSSNCNVLTSSTTRIPLICDYKNWINLNLPTIKNLWKTAISGLISTINHSYTGYTAGCIPSYAPYSAITSGATCSEFVPLISYEFFTDSDGVEKVKFISNTNSLGDCLVKEYMDFYFDASYQHSLPECKLDIKVETPCDVYTGSTECKLKSDLIFNITGVTTQQAYGNIPNWGVYVFRKCDPLVNTYLDYSSVYSDVKFLKVDNQSCQFLLSGVTEDDQIDILFTDAANCDKKIKIQGLNLQYVEYPTEVPDDPANVHTGYTITPKVQYRNTYNYGLKHDTKVLVISGATINSSTTSDNIESYITAGTLVKKNVKDLVAGNKILSAQYDLCSTLSSSDFELGELNNDYSFSYTYSSYTISDIDCLGSVKKSVVSGTTVDGSTVVFEVLPTSKFRVYTNKDVTRSGSSSRRKGYFFDTRYPELLQIKPETPIEPCCDYPSDYYDTGDFIITEKGELIEVTAVDVNYCEPNLFYNINITGATSSQPTNLITFNGNSNYLALIEHQYIGFNRPDISLQQYYYDANCLPYDEATMGISALTRNYTGLCSGNKAYVCGDTYPLSFPTPTPTSTPTPTPTSTPSPTPTKTPTPTPTPTTSPTPTPTPTSTEIVPTPTPTSADDFCVDIQFATPTPTSTSVSPTATPTSTSVSPTATPTSTEITPTATPTSTAVIPTPTPTSTAVIPTPTPTETSGSVSMIPLTVRSTAFASHVETELKVWVKVNGGTWEEYLPDAPWASTTTNGFMSNYPNISSTINANVDDIIYIGLTNSSGQDIQYGVGQNQNNTDAYDLTKYIGYCGKSLPYSFTATSNNIVYFDINISGGYFITCDGTTTNYSISTGYTAPNYCNGLGGSDLSVYGNDSNWTSVTRFFTNAGMTVPFNGANLYYGDSESSNGTTLQIDNNGYVINYYAC